MKSLFTSIALVAACAAQAQTAPVAVQGAWARASVQGQTASGAFMTITPREATTLVGVASPVAGVAELHEMKMEGDVMRMRPVPALALAAGKPFALRPGGHHLMLMDLKAPLQVGTQVPLTLTFRDAKGATSSLVVGLPVLARAPEGAAAAPAHKH
jgi:copper(I)-binding protein